MLIRISFVPPDALATELRHLTERLAQLPGVTPAPPDRLEVSVVRLDHVEDDDLPALTRAVRDAVAQAPVPLVHCQGMRLMPRGLVTVELVGDVEGLLALARTVGEAAASVHQFAEEPVFHGVVPLARVSERWPGSLAQAEALVEQWRGSSWPLREVGIERTVTHETLAGVTTSTEPVAWLPVGDRRPVAG